MKYLLILLSILLLSSPLFGQSMETGVLYRWDTGDKVYVWKTFGDKGTNPKYKGEIKNGKPEGFGIITNMGFDSNYSDGRKYVGEYKDGNENGQGTYTWSDGHKYVGEFKDGLPNGQGTQTFPNGDKYVGEFKDGQLNGQGTYTWSDGNKYVGEYKDGKRNGQGTQTLPNGMKYVGKWKDEEEWNGTIYRKNGNNFGKFVNGKMIKQ